MFWEGFDHNPIIYDFCIKRKSRIFSHFFKIRKCMWYICNFINALGQLIPRLVQTTCPEKKQIFIKFFGQMSYSFFFCNTSSQNQYPHTVKSQVLTRLHMQAFSDCLWTTFLTLSNILWPFPNYTRDRNVFSRWFLAGNQVNHQNFDPSLLTNNLWRVVRFISDQSLCKYLNIKYQGTYLK